MKIKTKIRMNEIAQIIPIVVIAVIALVAMSALIIDGGALLFNRRSAQAAADAGAMAGARADCFNTGADPLAVAQQYAVTENGATSAIASYLNGMVNVKASISQNSFFAGIFGQNTLDVAAEAEAGCFAPEGKAILPLAWYCAPPSGEGPFNPEYGCQMQTLSWNDLGPLADPNWEPAGDRVTALPISDSDGNVETYYMDGTNVVDAAGIPPEQVYIVMDSDKICVEDVEVPSGDEVQCDLDGDGKKDILTSGDRGWLYLTADTNSIGKWITDPPTFIVETHQWLSGKSGGDTAVYKDMITAGLMGKLVLIPVFNYLCDGDPRDEDYAYCVTEAHTPPNPVDDDIFDEIKNTQGNYHIIVFQPFYMACVDKKGDCPGFNYAKTLPNGDQLKDIPVVEGFFLTDVDLSLDTTQNCDVNLGNCTISLSK